MYKPFKEMAKFYYINQLGKFIIKTFRINELQRTKRVFRNFDPL